MGVLIFRYSSPKSFFGFILLLGIFIASFQNCSGKEDSGTSQDQNSRAILNGNGTGYGGKASHVNYDFDQVCGMDPLGVRSQIIEASGSLFLVKDNCIEIQPQMVNASQLQLKEHNDGYLIRNEKLYEKQFEASYSEIFCRGEGEDPVTGNFEVADAFIRIVDGKLYGNIKYGIYRDGAIVEKKEELNIRVQSRDFVHIGGRVSRIYSSLPTLVDMSLWNWDFILDVDKETLVASLHSVKFHSFSSLSLPQESTQIPNLPAPPPDGSSDLPVPLTIEGMQCSIHGQELF